MRQRFGDFSAIVETDEPASAFWLAALAADTMAQVLAGEATPLPPSILPLNQYYAATLRQYLSNGLKRSIW